jgi:hypothetical protein
MPAVDIYDPEFFLREDVHETFAAFRRDNGVYWQEMPGESGY